MTSAHQARRRVFHVGGPASPVAVLCCDTIAYGPDGPFCSVLWARGGDVEAFFVGDTLDQVDARTSAWLPEQYRKPARVEWLTGVTYGATAFGCAVPVGPLVVPPAEDSVGGLFGW